MVIPCLSTWSSVRLPWPDLTPVKDFVRIFKEMMFMKDGAEHMRLRRLGSHGFTNATLDEFRPVIQKLTEDLVAKFKDRGHGDIVDDLAQPLPAIAIAEMFGIPLPDRRAFQEWSDDIARFFGGTLGDVQEDAKRANTSAVALEQYLLKMLEERRHNRGKDLMSLFIGGQDEGKLTAEEVCGQCILVLAAGHVTTIDQIANSTNALLHHPNQLRNLREDPSLLKGAVEEALRYDGAVAFTNRIAIEDIEMRGKTIKKGQMVFLGIGAANRDPEVFEDPDRFDITRANNKHIGFGFSSHMCLGVGFARRELEIGLSVMLEALLNLRLDPSKPARRKCESMLFRGFHSLPVLF